MAAILDLPEVRERVRRWTVAEYVALTEDNPFFRHSELIRGLIVQQSVQERRCTSLLTKNILRFLAAA